MALDGPEVFRIEDAPQQGSGLRLGPILLILALFLGFCLVALGPWLAFRIGFSWELGRSEATAQMLRQLDEQGVLSRSSGLFRMAATRVMPSVVQVRTNGLNRVGGFGVESGIGSGVIYDRRRGYIVTNNHVIQNATSITVKLQRGQELVGRLVGADPKTDLAVIQVPAPLPVEAAWGDSDSLDVGDWVLAVGSPFFLEQSVSAGIVSATRRSNIPMLQQEEIYQDFIQTDAAINPGNSGGPLVNLKGEVVGINTAILSETGFNQGIGLAIPASVVKPVVEQLIVHQRVIRGYMGVLLEPLDPAEAREIGIDPPQGAKIASLVPGSPAEKAQMRVGDIVVRLDGEPVRDVADLRNKIGRLGVGSRVKLEFYREGQLRSLEVVLAELPSVASLGFTVRSATPEESVGLNLRRGPGVIVTQVGRDTPAERAGLRPGMALLRINRIPVFNPAQCDQIVMRLMPGEEIFLQVRQPDGTDGILVIAPSGGNP